MSVHFFSKNDSTGICSWIKTKISKHNRDRLFCAISRRAEKSGNMKRLTPLQLEEAREVKKKLDGETCDGYSRQTITNYTNIYGVPFSGVKVSPK
jgi:hypothetical protein